MLILNCLLLIFKVISKKVKRCAFENGKDQKHPKYLSTVQQTTFLQNK